MKKNYLVIGIVLVIMGVFLISNAASSNLGLIANYTKSYITTIGPYNALSFPIRTNGTDEIKLAFYSSQPVDFFILNASAYKQILPTLASSNSILNQSIALEGKGAVYIVTNSEYGIFPKLQQNTSSLYTVYYSQLNTSSNVPAGTYYDIMQNTQNQTVSLRYYVIQYNEKALISQSSGQFVTTLIGIFCFLGGMGLALFGIVKKNLQQEEQEKKPVVDQEEIDRLYKNVGKKKKPKK